MQRENKASSVHLHSPSLLSQWLNLKPEWPSETVVSHLSPNLQGSSHTYTSTTKQLQPYMWDSVVAFRVDNNNRMKFGNWLQLQKNFFFWGGAVFVKFHPCNKSVMMISCLVKFWSQSKERRWYVQNLSFLFILEIVSRQKERAWYCAFVAAHFSFKLFIISILSDSSSLQLNEKKATTWWMMPLVLRSEEQLHRK